MADTAYQTVTWTAGDIITEAKMDNMVSNDRAYDAHQDGILLEERSAPSNPAANKIHLYAADDGGTTKAYLKDSAGSVTEIGAGGLPADGWNVYSAVTPTRASADDPTYVLTFAGVDLTSLISVGMKIKLTQSTDKYFIVTAIAFSTDTTLTLYGGTDYDVADTGVTAISAFYYSPVKAPLGFPMDVTKWTFEFNDTSDRTQASPTGGTWYNAGSISTNIPIGSWDLSFIATLDARKTGLLDVFGALSTSNNSVSDTELQAKHTGDGNTIIAQTINVRQSLVLSSKTTYYPIIKTTVSGVSEISFLNGNTPLIVRAICTYL